MSIAIHDPDVFAAELESTELTAEDSTSIQEAAPSSERVTYSGTDFDVEGLVRRLDREDIVIPTFGLEDSTIETAGFQRSFVWRRPQMDKFIESLLLGYPIPGIILVQQLDRRYLVLDGQQRLTTLKAFYSGVHEKKVFELENVADIFKGRSYKSLPDELRRTLDNTFVQATIVKTDGSAPSLEAVYQIFERLNSGGTQLTPHEIRVALYSGDLVKLLTELNSDPFWRKLYGPQSPRLRDQEIVLRFLSLYVSPGTYKRPQKTFLNDFAAIHRNLEGLDIQTLRLRFSESCRLLLESVGSSATRTRISATQTGRQVNAAQAEAVLVGLSNRLDQGPSPSAAKIAEAFRGLSTNQAFLDSILKATSNDENVRTRLALARAAFSSI